MDLLKFIHSHSRSSTLCRERETTRDTYKKKAEQKKVEQKISSIFHFPTISSSFCFFFIVLDSDREDFNISNISSNLLLLFFHVKSVFQIKSIKVSSSSIGRIASSLGTPRYSHFPFSHFHFRLCEEIWWWNFFKSFTPAKWREWQWENIKNYCALLSVLFHRSNDGEGWIKEGVDRPESRRKTWLHKERNLLQRFHRVEARGELARVVK